MMKLSTKQNLIFLFVFLAGILFRTESSFAQCLNNNSYYTDLTTTFDGDISSASCIFGGEYCTADVCAGVSYEFSTCGAAWDTQITLYSSTGTYLDFDDDGCGISGGGSDLFWTSNFTGTVWILVDLYNCISNSSCAPISVTQFGTCSIACANNNTFYNVNATPTGPGNTVTVGCMYAGEYLNVNVCAGANYTFSACAAAYDTQLSLYSSAGDYLAYDDDYCGTNAGSAIFWTAPFSGTVRLLLDQYQCTSNSTCTSVTITQNTSCLGACDFTTVTSSYQGCTGSLETVNFYPYFTGSCTIEGMYLYTNTLGTEYIDLSAYGFTSGDAIGINLGVDNELYTYYFVLSDGSTSLDYFYSTGTCPQVGCSFSTVLYDYLGCNGSDEQVVFYPYYNGACIIDGVWSYTPTTGWFYLDLSANGYTSGDAINLYLPYDYTDYQYYFVLSDGTTSDTYTYSTGGCDLPTCSVSSVQYLPVGCVGTSEEIDFYVYFTGPCSVYSIWSNANGTGWQELVLTGTFFSGDPITIDFLQDNSIYQYYFTLSDGTTSSVYTYTTGNCDNPITCTNLQIDYNDTGCVDTGTSNVPSGDIIPFYNGICTVEGVYSSVNGGPYEYLDLSAFGYTSGDAMSLFFNIQDANYDIYYVLSDGSTSPVVSFITTTCLSGITVCDCAGTQLPIEATAWLGDGALDNGTYYWGGDLSLPVNFNCATWGFDCGDGLAPGFFSYDPYGVCSGALPPSNGCVDEFCYNIDLDVATDCHPEDVTVYILNSNGDLVFIADNTDFIVLSDNLYSFPICLPAGCYTYVINDAFGDGLAGGDCTSIGYSGIYNYTTGNYQVFINGDGYATTYSAQFCVGPQTVCDNLGMYIEESPCTPSGTTLLPSINYTFDFTGPCTVQSIFYSLNGAAFVELDVSANGWGSGDQGALYYLQPNSDYVLYYTTNDGASSYLYAYSTSDCSNEITICDCDGTQLSIGVTSWLGDGFADNGFYQWAGQYVNFNCSTWGYDCSDISGAPAFDPYNVCGGQLPPFNGCSTVNEVLGCTDPTAINYNPQATINDGSCIYNIQIGCTDPGACNYSDLAVIDNGSCEYVTCAGCMDPTATNYDPTATISDNSCIYIEIPGCTDPTAFNYDPLATQNDGSCIYNCIWPTVIYDSHCTQGDLNSFYIDVEVSTLGNGAPYTITNSNNNQQQVMSLTGSFTMGPFANGTPVVIQVTSNTIDCLLTSQPMSENCAAGGVYGCTDPQALNYNPAATIDDGSCTYPHVDEIGVAYFSMYPNPAKDNVTITNAGSEPLVTLRIIDNTGRVISSEQAVINNGTSHTLDVSTLASGNYLLEILGSKNVEHHSLIIQK